ncbi:hypothetical protein [Grimontia marina]|nr:hypothetical protein [Grimontia marina]
MTEAVAYLHRFPFGSSVEREDVTAKQVLGVFLKGKYYVVLDRGKVVKA